MSLRFQRKYKEYIFIFAKYRLWCTENLLLNTLKWRGGTAPFKYLLFRCFLFDCAQNWKSSNTKGRRHQKLVSCGYCLTCLRIRWCITSCNFVILSVKLTYSRRVYLDFWCLPALEELSMSPGFYEIFQFPWKWNTIIFKFPRNLNSSEKLKNQLY
jgi:hypothetical protein